MNPSPSILEKRKAQRAEQLRQDRLAKHRAQRAEQARAEERRQELRRLAVQQAQDQRTVESKRAAAIDELLAQLRDGRKTEERLVNQRIAAQEERRNQRLATRREQQRQENSASQQAAAQKASSQAERREQSRAAERAQQARIETLTSRRRERQADDQQTQNEKESAQARVAQRQLEQRKEDRSETRATQRKEDQSKRQLEEDQQTQRQEARREDRRNEQRSSQQQEQQRENRVAQSREQRRQQQKDETRPDTNFEQQAKQQERRQEQQQAKRQEQQQAKRQEQQQAKQQADARARQRSDDQLQERRQRDLESQRQADRQQKRIDERSAQQRGERADEARAAQLQNERREQRRDEAVRSDRQAALRNSLANARREQRQAEDSARQRADALRMNEVERRRSDRQTLAKNQQRRSEARAAAGSARTQQAVAERATENLQWLRTQKNCIVDENERRIDLRGVNVAGLDEVSLKPGQTLREVLGLDTRGLEILTGLWGANIVRLPFRAQTMLVGNESLSANRLLEELDDLIGALAGAGAYTLLALQAPSTEIATPLPDADTLRCWLLLANRYQDEPGVLFEIYSASSPFSSGWPQSANELIGEIRREHPASLIFVSGNGAGADTSGLPLRFATDDPVHDLIYTVRFTPLRSPTRSDPRFIAFAQSYPVFASEWSDSGLDLGRTSESVGQLLERYGIGWTALNWNAEPRLVRNAAANQFTATRFGNIVRRALTSPVKPQIVPFPRF